MTTKLEHSTTSPWLYHFIQLACKKGWCVNIGCTTCGAHDFRNELTRLIENHTTLSNRCDEVANQLRQLSPKDADSPRFSDALKMVFHQLNQPLIFDGCPDLSVRLAGSWAGQQLAVYLEHQQARAERRAAHDKLNSADAIQARKQEREQAKIRRIAEQPSNNGRKRRPERFTAWLTANQVIPTAGEAPITPELANSFISAHFEVAGIILVPGRHNQELANLLAARKTKEAVFITAHNPRGRQVEGWVNQQLQRMLSEIARKRWAYCCGWGGSPDGDWPQEPSLLIFGASLPEGRELAVQFGQAAYLHIQAGNVRLVATDETEQRLLDQCRPPTVQTQ